MIINRLSKIVLGAMLILGAFPAGAAAQVTVTLTLPSAKALLYEEVVATVVIQNNSGNMLTLDSKQGVARFWLDVESGAGRIVRRRDDTPLVRAAEIMPGQARTFTFNVTRLFAVRNQGIYKIRAGVEMNGVYYISPEAELEVVSGFELQRLTAGMAGDTPVIRRYIRFQLGA